jgi:hypothetical protein
MNARLFLTIVSTAVLAIPAGAQVQRRATMTGGGNGGSGHCTGEVVVDGAADVQIRGDTATVRDVSGQQPQIRRFECTSLVPATASLRANVNGRGEARVTAMPNNGSPAVIHIEDHEGGASTYQFDIAWGNTQGNNTQGYNNQGYNNQGYNSQGYPPPAVDRRDSERGWNGGWNGGRRFTNDQAINVCRDAVRQQAADRFGTRDVNIGRIRIDDNPGRNDWVVGNVDVRRGGRDVEYPFSCSVNFDTGRVRTAQIDAPSQGYAGRDAEARGMDKCRDAVSNRIRGRVDIHDMRMDPDGDLIRGSAWAQGQSWDFSCRVSPYDGDVRDLNVSPRR